MQIILFSACCLFPVCGCDAENMTTLAEVSRPYVGEYRCEKLLLGGEDCMEGYEYVLLTLDREGNFQLSYLSREGAEGGYGGAYQMNREGDEITFTAKKGLLSVSRTFPLDNGTILIDVPFRGKLLHAEFVFS